MKIPFLRILKTSADPSSFKFLALTIFVSLNCQNPTSSYEVFNLMLSSIATLHSSKVQETAKFFKLGLLDLFCIFLWNLRCNHRFCLWRFLSILRKILTELSETSNITGLEIGSCRRVSKIYELVSFKLHKFRIIGLSVIGSI